MNKSFNYWLLIYNIEKYLAKCLDSLINQTLEDIEIICVNDSSTNNSAEILNEYTPGKDCRKNKNYQSG